MKNNNNMRRFALGFIVLGYTGVACAQYTFYDGDYGSLSAGLHVQTAGLGEINNRAGDFYNGFLSDIYWELTVEPNVKAAINLPYGSQFYGGFSMIYSAMLGYDPSFITYRDSSTVDDYTDWFMNEEAYIGWRSGKLFEQWGENAIDLSAGAQDYKLGTGLLLANGTDDGGYRGSYWIGSRTAFVDTIIARINIGNWKLEGFHLKNRPRTSGGLRKYNGMNVEYNYHDIANFAFSYINDDDYTGLITAETDAYDIRVSFLPLPDLLPDLSISTEYVRQLNNKLTDDNTQTYYYLYGEKGRKTVSGGFGQIEYKFSELPWQPTLSYRYAITGYGFDFMNFGFKTWGTWFQGEMTGEFIYDNTNLISNVARLVLTPTDGVSVNLIYYNYKFVNPKGAFPDFDGNALTSRNYANEVDLVVDWAVTDTIDLAAGIETFIPDLGGKQTFNSRAVDGDGVLLGGGNKMWVQGMVYASIKF